MVIKTESGTVFANLLIMSILDIAIFWILVLKATNITVMTLGFVAILMNSSLWLSDMVYNGRTLVMDQEGCTVIFGAFHKRYLWSDLQTRRLEYFTRTGESSRGVVFAKKHIRSMNYEDPGKDALLKMFSVSFYVSFDIDDAERINKYELIPVPKYYKVDEKEFLTKMHEWGVKIENGLPPEKRKNYPWDWV